jgi:hypothetical protein
MYSPSSIEIAICIKFGRKKQTNIILQVKYYTTERNHRYVETNFKKVDVPHAFYAHCNII